MTIHDIDIQAKLNANLEDEPAIADHMSSILEVLGEDLNREGLRDTPMRYARAMRFLTSGYVADINEIVGSAVFHEDSSEIVMIRDIEFFSMCEHHMLPFYGKAHVAYLPNGKIIGLSKIPRLVDAFSRRLQVQERLTTQIANTVMDILNPLGVAVIVEAFHMCMMMRGVEKQSSTTVTSAMLGEFRDNPTTRKEVLSLLNNNRQR